jgi:hypothetical protein
MGRQSVVAEFRDAYYSELDAGEQSALISVDVAVGAISAVGSVFAALPVLRKVARRQRGRGKETESQPAGA